MQWLILNIWILLTSVAAFALAFGWSFRGLMAARGVRRAEMERDVVQTELSQARSEIEALYAAQRKEKTGVSEAQSEVAALRAELAERDVSLNLLNHELATARTDVERLRREAKDTSDGLPATGASVLGAVSDDTASGVTADDADSAELEQIKARNAWLEERVAQLEGDLAQTAISDAPGPQVSVAHEKMQWRTHYLSQRVGALETALMSARAPQAASPTPTAATADQDAGMARLRWRNRYLEGRLAYYEGQSPDETETTRRESGPVRSLVEAVAEEPATPVAETIQPSEPIAELADTNNTAPARTPVDTEPRDAEPSDTELTHTEDDAAPDGGADDAHPALATDDPVEDPTQVHPCDAMLAELDDAGAPAEPEMAPGLVLVAPESQAQPSGGGDDLTQIDGIGPKIAEVLNGLGIWTFAQIADWTSENAAWIDDHLAFSGRVARENWVGQADAVVSATTSDAAS